MTACEQIVHPVNQARQNGKLTHVPHIPMLKERNVRTGFFEREQIDRILAHLPPAIRPAVQFAYITGWRIPSEALPMQWRHVDFEARVVRLDPHRTKNDEGRTFHSRAITHRLCRLIWKILHQRIRYEERGPAVSTEAKKVRARKMFRELRSLGSRVRAAHSSTRPSSLMQMIHVGIVALLHHANHSPSMELQTSRLLLRDFTLADIDAVHAYQSDPRYLEHTPWRTRPRADVADFVQMMVEWSLARPRIRYQLAIVHGAVLIGSCGIRQSARDAIEAEFGCELAPAAWGHGYAAEASRAILAFGFSELRLRRIFARTTTTNRRAVALSQRLGMREEASAHQADRSDNTVALGISSPAPTA